MRNGKMVDKDEEATNNSRRIELDVCATLRRGSELRADVEEKIKQSE
jgi:hypothetical protein